MIPTLFALAAATAAPAAADTARFVVLNHGRLAGDMVIAAHDTGVLVRYHHTDRNRGQRVQTEYRFGDAGVPIRVEVRPLDAAARAGDVNERFEAIGDSATWSRGRSEGGVRLDAPAFYRAGSNTPYDRALLAAWLLDQPGRRGSVLPGGTATASVLADTIAPTAAGTERVRFIEITLPGGVSSNVWIDADGDLFASGIGWFITVRPDAQDALPLLRGIEMALVDERTDRIAAALMPAAIDALVIRGADVFDTERGVLVPDRTIIVRGDRIAEVGARDSVAVPAGARVIEADGMTVMPGMWDMHGHLQHFSPFRAAPLQLAAGITTVRDLAADLDVAVSHRDRANALEIVAPRVLLGGFIEGPGAWAGPTEALARTEDEARAWVARYDSLGYRQIKLYNLVHPDLVPVIADETRRRGMRLSGHVPRGMSVPAAVRLGFDEINHAAFLFSTFFPDSLFTPTMRPYSGVAADVAPGFDVDGEVMTALIDVLREHGTVIDGTFNLWMGGRSALDGEMSDGARSYARLLKRLHDAGVTIVPGTDNLTSSSYLTELELYQLAGIPAPDVLRMATLTSARVMGEDADYGSITPGKVADIIVVDGRPSERVADLEEVRYVMRAGRVYTPDELRAATRVRADRGR
jgi:hypothetical protein